MAVAICALIHSEMFSQHLFMSIDSNPYQPPKEHTTGRQRILLRKTRALSGLLAAFGLPVSAILISATLPAPHYVPWPVGVMVVSIAVLSVLAGFVWLLLATASRLAAVVPRHENRKGEL